MDPIDDRLAEKMEGGGSRLLGYNTNAGMSIHMRCVYLESIWSATRLIPSFIHSSTSPSTPAPHPLYTSCTPASNPRIQPPIYTPIHTPTHTPSTPSHTLTTCSHPLHRLRTMDLSGFEPYSMLIDTLLHELAHNEVGPHNDSFWHLFGQLKSDYLHHHAHLSASGSIFGGVSPLALAGVADQARGRRGGLAG